MYSSGTAAGQRLLFGGMYSKKGYGQEQPVPVACAMVHACAPTSQSLNTALVENATYT